MFHCTILAQVGGMIDEVAIRFRWDAVGLRLDERGQRLFAAAEVQTAGRGGLAVVSKITGLALPKGGFAVPVAGAARFARTILISCLRSSAWLSPRCSAIPCDRHRACRIKTPGGTLKMMKAFPPGAIPHPAAGRESRAILLRRKLRCQ